MTFNHARVAQIRGRAKPFRRWASAPVSVSCCTAGSSVHDSSKGKRKTTKAIHTSIKGKQTHWPEEPWNSFTRGRRIISEDLGGDKPPPAPAGAAPDLQTKTLRATVLWALCVKANSELFKMTRKKIKATQVARRSLSRFGKRRHIGPKCPRRESLSPMATYHYLRRNVLKGFQLGY